MENYIIRVYRRDKSNPYEIVGQVQDVLSDSAHSFKHIDELIEVLTKPEGVCGQGKKKSKNRITGKGKNK